MLKLNNKAFLLVEVMVAVTILAVALMLILRSFVSSLRVIKLSHNFLAAQLLLEEKILQKQQEQAKSETAILEDEQGEFDPPFDNFGYQIEFEQLDSEGTKDLPGLYTGSFEVSWQQSKSKWSSSSLTYIRSK